MTAPRTRQLHAPPMGTHCGFDILPQSSNARLSHQHHQPRLRYAHPPTSFRAFSGSSIHPRNAIPDYYANLSLSPQASGKEIKSQFYALSKQHHPDVTRTLSDSEAASHRRKFEMISEAYSVLGDPEKKSSYDRECNAASSGAVSGGEGGGGAAQYSRGGRPASGLSSRRGTFRGPPPSFYRSGAWGTSTSAAGRRRREAAEGVGQRQRSQTGANGDPSGRGNHSAGSTSSGNDAGAEESWPFRTDPNDVRHFDRAGHYRTTTNVEEQLRRGRRKRRAVLMQARQEAMQHGTRQGMDATFPEEVGPAKEMRSFLTVAGIVLLGCGGGWIIFGAY